MKQELIIQELKAALFQIESTNKSLEKQYGNSLLVNFGLRAPLSRLRFVIDALEASEADTVRLGKENEA